MILHAKQVLQPHGPLSLYSPPVGRMASVQGHACGPCPYLTATTSTSLHRRRCSVDWQQLYRPLPAGCLHRRRPFSDQGFMALILTIDCLAFISAPTLSNSWWDLHHRLTSVHFYCHSAHTFGFPSSFTFVIIISH